ncbi:hypothetical protein Glove_117g478 [Diversispora epigaea]|uniref:Uncharacterized protein n=1 Tax=Diversispora epigaea TaxID=1348612 RepID=A0A397IZX4_9GLOM|nr:hypothetical protein Glove_117g478 [Diversispora epigaea]
MEDDKDIDNNEDDNGTITINSTIELLKLSNYHSESVRKTAILWVLSFTPVWVAWLNFTNYYDKIIDTNKWCTFNDNNNNQ